MRPRLSFVLALALLLTVVSAGPAVASQVSRCVLPTGPECIDYRAATGEVNSLTIGRFDSVISHYRVRDLGAVITPGTDCAAVDANTVDCLAAGFALIDLGDGGETATTANSGLAALVGGGSGGDTLTGGPLADVLTGGGDRDILFAGRGADILMGEAGNDELSGGEGDDRLIGREGADVFDGGPGADVMQGQGPTLCAFVAVPGVGWTLRQCSNVDPDNDTDTVDYSSRNNAVRVTLDGSANDGEPGERDNADLGVDTVVGGSGPDTLIAEDGSTTPNELQGRDGNDDLIAEVGEDKLSGGSGQDLIIARDGDVDQVVCGPDPDEAVVDGDDVVAPDCERVREGASAEVQAGYTVRTGVDATDADPFVTAVATPDAGRVSIEEERTTVAPPTGFSLLGWQVDISAPPASVDKPLSITFRIHRSLLPPGTTASTLAIFRNGILVGNCTEPLRAVPDPCVAVRRTLPDGDVELVVLTSRASLWTFGVDTEAPTLTVPGPITENAVSPAGLVVSFADRVAATDNADPEPTVICSPRSGSTFAIGSTTVTCTATDTTGNSASRSFVVTVRGAPAQIAALIDKTLAYLELPALEAALKAQLGAAAVLLAKNKTAACRALRLYIAVVRLAPRSGLTAAQRAELVADARRIKAVVGCP
jgi:serralysin